MEHDTRQKSEGLSIRSGRLEGVVVSTKTKKTAIVQRHTTKYISKYGRYAKVKLRIAAHVPDGITVNVGDYVVLGETRKISKTKAWAVIDVKGATK